MGRPKKQTPTVSMRIDEDAHDLARQACSFTKESIVDYVSRVVRERASAEVQAVAERIFRDSQKEAKKRAKGKGTPD